jgi:hypothetical protein
MIYGMISEVWFRPVLGSFSTRGANNCGKSDRFAKVCLRIALLDRIDDAEAAAAIIEDARATARITSLLEAWYANPMRRSEIAQPRVFAKHNAGRWLSRIRVLPVPPTGPTTSGPGVVPINTQLEDILQR